MDVNIPTTNTMVKERLNIFEIVYYRKIDNQIFSNKLFLVVSDLDLE